MWLGSFWLVVHGGGDSRLNLARARVLPQPVVTDQLGEGPASRRRRVRAVIFGRRRVAEHDDGARGSLGRDAQDPLCLRLLIVVAEPGRAAAKPEESRPDQHPLRDPTLIERLGAWAFAGEHDGNRQRCVGDPVDGRSYLADLAQKLAVRDDDELPRLGVARAARPTSDL